MCFSEQCYVGSLYAEYDIKAITWFLKEQHFRMSKVRAMLMMLNGALLSLLLYQQNLVGFFQNNNENNCEYKNKETVRRLPRRLCMEDLFRQTREHRLEQTYLSDALMPDEIMNPRYKFSSKLMREVLVFLDSYKDPSFVFSPSDICWTEHGINRCSELILFQ